VCQNYLYKESLYMLLKTSIFIDIRCFVLYQHMCMVMHSVTSLPCVCNAITLESTDLESSFWCLYIFRISLIFRSVSRLEEQRNHRVCVFCSWVHLPSTERPFCFEILSPLFLPITNCKKEKTNSIDQLTDYT